MSTHKSDRKINNVFEEHMDAILQAMGIGVVTIGSDGRVYAFNKAAEIIFGYDKSKVIGENVSILMPPQFSEVNDKKIEWNKKVGIRGLEVVGLRKNGITFPMELTIGMIKIDNEVYFTLAIQDITERKKTEEENHRISEELSRSAQMKAQFMADMSHEIRTPMNAIIGMADLLAETPLNSEQKRYVQIFQKSGELLLSIINDILDFSKIEANGIEIDRTPINLKNIIEDVIAVCRPKATSKNLQLTYFIENQFNVGVLGDSVRIRQILMNLVTNAIKFTGEGLVSLYLGINDNKSKKGNVCISVTDTGMGLSPEKQKTLFKAYSQADTTITKKFGGTGLGLVISKKLTEMMDGELWLTSEEGRGSTFWFTFSAQPADVDDRFEVTIKTNRFNDKCILIVDEHEINQALYKEMISPLGVKIVLYKNCEEAFVNLKKMKEQQMRVDAILIDSYFSSGNVGIDFIRRIKTEKEFQNIPTLLVNAEDSRTPVSQLYREGAAFVLHRPVRKETLLSELSLALYSEEDIKKDFGLLSAPATNIATSLSGAVILLVDDSEDNRMLIKAFCKNMDCKIIEANNGKIAVEKVKTEKIDIVLMDIQMPVMDGYEATSKIRQWEKEAGRGHLPIIALTAHALVEDKQRCLNSGFTEHLSKPIKKQILLEMLVHLYQKNLREAA